MSWTRGLQEFMGCLPDGDDCTHEWWRGRIHPDDQEAYDAAASQLQAQGAQMAVEYRVRTHDGCWVPLLDEAVVVGDSTTGAVHVMGSIHDMSRFRNWEQVQESADLFLNKLSHDMRTPLGSILIWLQILKRGGLNDEENRRALEALKSSATMLGEFVEEMSDLSRMIAGEARLRLRPVQLAGVIEAAVSATGPSALAKQIQVDKTLDPQTVAVSGDPDRLQLLVRALLSNAFMFTPRDGRVRITLAQSDSFAHITVSDDGPGIGADLDRILEGFPPTTKRSRDVGLQLAHLLALLHGGSVTARTEGAGNALTVKLPLLR